MTKHITAEDFIKVWQTSSNTADVCKKLGRTMGAIQSRAVYFRKHGIPLKKFSRGSQDWEKLKKLALSLTK